MEECRNLSVHFLNGFLLSLVRLQNLEKLLVYLRLILEAVLRRGKQSV